MELKKLTHGLTGLVGLHLFVYLGTTPLVNDTRDSLGYPSPAMYLDFMVFRPILDCFYYSFWICTS